MATRFTGPYAPLPPDYPELTSEGMRQARVNACTLQETPEDLVVAWRMFNGFYLDPLPVGEFYKRKIPDAPCHAEMIHSVGAHRKNVWAFPRGFAKSTKAEELMLLLFCTRPNFSIAYCRNTKQLAWEMVSKIKDQLEFNEYLQADFGVLKPNRGKRSWSLNWLWANNGAQLRAVATESKQRGGRPDLYVLDDPEFDPKKTTNTQMLRENLENFLFHVVLPMLERDCGFLWVGTMINRRTLLHAACYGEDARFETWNRQIRAAEFPAPSGLGTAYLWPEKMGPAECEAKKSEIGLSAYASEYLNQPVADSEKLFRIHDQYCTYTMERLPDTVPFETATPVTYVNPPAKPADAPQVVTVPYGELVGKMTRVLLADPIQGVPGPMSDFQAIVVVGFTRPADILWPLDVWLGKEAEPRFIERIWKMALRWRPAALGLEANSTQKYFVDRFRAQWVADAALAGYAPRVYPIVQDEDKARRISGMGWRFDYYRIKLPLCFKKLPGWRELFFQIENFSMDIEAALPNDDVLDALAMHQQVVRPRQSTRTVTPKPERIDPVQMILGGKRFVDGTTFDVGQMIDLSQITDEILDKRRELMYGKRQPRERGDDGTPLLNLGGKTVTDNF